MLEVHAYVYMTPNNPLVRRSHDMSLRSHSLGCSYCSLYCVGVLFDRNMLGYYNIVLAIGTTFDRMQYG